MASGTTPTQSLIFGSRLINLMKNPLFNALALGGASLLLALPLAQAWNDEGHRIVTRLALASLPPEFPAFARDAANASRVEWLANTPDRWRNVDPWLRQSGGSWLDHFIDIEYLPRAGIDPRSVPSMRNDFIVMFAAARAANAEKFDPIDPAKNAGHTEEWPGFAPWAITEYFEKLRSAFGYLKAYQDFQGSPDEIANARADALYAMGIMAHYIGDCAQPLHTTAHFNGWTGANPKGYTKWPGIHSWIDGGFIGKAKITAELLRPRTRTAQPLAVMTRADGRNPMFVVVMDYILAQFEQVEPLYRLEKDGLLGRGDQPITSEGRAFIEGQLLTGGEMLARVWLTAWLTAAPDPYLRTALTKKKIAAEAKLAPAGGGE